ncbi:hypothetical protein DEO72_LG2g3927 [Vigna unguiculata]|uniref:Uncharacterized protein n=1 Tax=Vigna unguiculata TaxID=3917 RepID=A0A4D6L4Z2_VIGUN|nr:hypothetical protein DEO72_LG2g3927 [Vigna unguiculata]
MQEKPNIYSVIAWRCLSAAKRKYYANRLAGHPRCQAPSPLQSPCFTAIAWRVTTLRQAPLTLGTSLTLFSPDNLPYPIRRYTNSVLVTRLTSRPV